jgi:hypothetical protein
MYLNARILIYFIEFDGAAKHVRWLVKFKIKSLEGTCTRDAWPIGEAASDANTNPSFPTAWFEQSSSPLNRIYALNWSGLMKITSSYLMYYFHIYEPLAPGPTPTGWFPLDLTYDNRNCFLLRFLAQIHTKELHASWHTPISLAQRKQCNISVFQRHFYSPRQTGI